jgi:hypothetical protein
VDLIVYDVMRKIVVCSGTTEHGDTSSRSLIKKVEECPYECC